MSIKIDGNGIITGTDKLSVAGEMTAGFVTTPGAVNAGSLAAPLAGVSTRVSTPQLKFPAVAVLSADPNTLDDYKEFGVWTPTFGAGPITVNEASYAKIGCMVWVQAQITFGPTSGGASVQFQGLPFLSVGSNPLSVGYVAGSTINSSQVTVMVVGPNINVYSGPGFATPPQFGNGGQLYFAGWYRTAS